MENTNIFNGTSPSHNAHKIVVLNRNGVPTETQPTNVTVHLDDTLSELKKKIIQSLGEDVVSYDEIYLFANVRGSIVPTNLFRLLTHNDDKPLTQQMFMQLAENMNIRLTENNNNNTNIDMEHDEFIHFFGENGVKPVDVVVATPLGKKFSNDTENYKIRLFPTNPFNFVRFYFEQETMMSFENQLLMNDGVIDDNKIMVCLAEDVLKHFEENLKFDEDEMKMVVERYFPLLFNQDVFSLNDLLQKKQELLSKNKKIITSQTKQLQNTIDMFYNVHDMSKTQLPYTDNTGVKEFNMTIKNNHANIPLEVIFKNIHVNKKIPMIKYIPGNKRENIYRLFTEHKTKDGKFIPHLSLNSILKHSKEMSRHGAVSSRIQKQMFSCLIVAENKEIIHFNITSDGNVHVHSTLKHPLSKEQLLNWLMAEVNPVVKTLNDFLEKIGFNIHFIHSLQNNWISTTNIHYVFEVPMTASLKLEKYMKCMSSVFDVIDDKLVKDGFIKLRFKRVENFNAMNAQTALLNDTFKKTNDLNEAVIVLMDNYDITKEEALERIQLYLTENNSEIMNEMTIRKKIMENPGFPVIFTSSLISEKIMVEVTNVSNVFYLDTLKIYIDTLLRLTQYPEISHVSVDDVLNSCKKNVVSNISSHVENIVVTQPFVPVQTIRFAPVDENDVDVVDDIDDGEIPFLLMDDEEDEKNDNINDETRPVVKPLVVNDDDDVVNDDFLLLSDDEDNQDKDEENSEEGEHNEEDEEEGEEDDEDKESDDEEKTPVFKSFFGRGKINGGENEQIIGKKIFGRDGVFLKRMREKDPVLFENDEEGNFKGYTRLCQSNGRLQPMIMSENEFKRMPKGSIDPLRVLKHGSNPDKPNYYVCPRYWCIRTNTVLTEDDILNGKCAGLKNANGEPIPDKIIPSDAKIVPKDAFVYEFKHPKNHVDPTGKYIEHFPGFVKDSKNPNSQCLPCCFKKPNHNLNICLPEQPPQNIDLEQNKTQRKPSPTQIVNATNQENLVEEEPEKEQIISVETSLSPQQQQRKKTDVFYIYGVETMPVKEINRFGFLPFSMQMFLQVDYKQAVSKHNPANIKPNIECLLRCGVEQVPKQSILGVFADLYAHFQKLKNVPTVAVFKEILKNKITLDIFIKSNNGFLVSVFKPVSHDTIQPDENVIAKYENTHFYKSLDMSISSVADFFMETVLSYENFIDYITKSNSVIDHTYLWDIITGDNPELLKGGVNMVIMEMTNDDITDNVKIICPTNSSHELFDPRKETVLLLKHGDYYEPIYSYKENNRVLEIKKTFYEHTQLKNVKHVLRIISSTQGKCGSKPSMPKKYRFKKNITLNELFAILKLKNYEFKTQVLNYVGKTIGLVAKQPSKQHKFVFIPCFPSVPLNEEMNVPKTMMDTDLTIWKDYLTTVDELNKIHLDTKGVVLCSPKFKVVDDNLIVGIITETNQFVQVNPPAENIVQDNLPVINSSNYIVVDKTITTEHVEDQERERVIKRINMEHSFYMLFRSIVRNTMNNYEHREKKKELLTIIENTKFLYREKFDKIMKIIKTIVGDKVTFHELSDEVVNDWKDDGDAMKNCVVTGETENHCSYVMPKTHLINGGNNEWLYFGRVADELVRNQRIKLFMFEPTKYSNIVDNHFKLNADEFLVLQNTLLTDELKGLKPHNTDENIHHVTFETAEPNVTQTYDDNIVTLKEQVQNPVEQEQPPVIKPVDLNDEIMVQCRDTMVDVIGNQSTSMWKRIFPHKTKEIVFRNDIACSFNVLVWIFQDKYKTQLSVKSVKHSLWNAYYELVPKYGKKILQILKKQGKENIVAGVEKGRKTLEQIVMDDNYYLTDLDIWVFCKIAKLQICLFSNNKKKLRGIDETLDWLMCGNAEKFFEEKHYFVRSPPIVRNEPASYNVIDKSFYLGELGEFGNIVKHAVLNKNQKNTQTVELFLAGV